MLHPTALKCCAATAACSAVLEFAWCDYRRWNVCLGRSADGRSHDDDVAAPVGGSREGTRKDHAAT